LINLKIQIMIDLNNEIYKSINQDCYLNKDIYNPNIFYISNFHEPEPSEINSSHKCRWSKGLFSIKTRKKVNNICLEFNINSIKKLILFIDGSQNKNLKFEFNLNVGEYVLYIPMVNEDSESITFYTEVVVPFQAGDTRNLGIFVREIFESNLNYDNVNLFDANKFKFHINESKIIDLPELKLTEQNETVKILDLNYSVSNFNFNSSVFIHENEKHLITRKSRYVTKNIHINTLNLFKFKKDSELFENVNLKINDEVEFEQYEDPRIFSYNDEIYVSCVNYVHDQQRLIHQKILVFDKFFNHIRNIHPVYGFNGKNIFENTGKEKNWTFFVYENRLMCVYKIHPHTVIEFDWNGNLLAEYKTFLNIDKIWCFGECRGGTNPILKDNYYHSFFHSSLPWKDGKRRYFMGYYKFESKPPFKIVEISQKPLLWANENDERILPSINTLVVFPCGAILENDRFLVSFGLNDEKSATVLI